MDRITVRVIDENDAMNDYSRDVPEGLPNDLAVCIGMGMLFAFDWSTGNDIQFTVYRNGVEIPPPADWQEV